MSGDASARAGAGAGAEPRQAGRARHPWLGLFVVCTGALVGPLDTAVNVAFPAVTDAFGLALRDIQWIVIAFVVAQSGFTIVFGRLGDVYGHRRIFAIGMFACVLAHFAAGFAPDYRSLVALRVFQGVAVGIAVACGPALATLLFAPQDKRRVLGIYVTTFSLGLAIGPLLGGVLVQWLGWPGVFWFRAPLALLVLALLPLLADVRAPRDGDGDGGAHVAPPVRSGLNGALPVRAGLNAAPPATPDPGSTRPMPPLVPLEPLRSPRFVALPLDSVIVNLACFAILLLVPYALARWPDQSIAASGALLALFPGGSLAGGLLAGQAVRRLSSAQLVRGGMLIAALGLLLTAALLPSGSAVALGAALFATGLGLGLFQVGYMDTTTSMLPPQDRGLAGALVTVTRLLGIVLGVTGIGALHEALGSFEQAIAAMGAGLLAFGVLAVFTRR